MDSTGVLVGSGGTTSTAGNDTYNASIITPNLNTGTYNVQDSIVDAGGSNDILNIIVTGANTTGGTAPVATVSGIETINVRAVMTTAADDITLAAGTFAGATSVNSDRSTSSVTVTGLSASQSFGIIGNASITNGISNAGFAATVTAGTLNILGGTLGTSVVTTSGTLLAANTVNSTGAANVIGALTLGAAVTTLNVNATTALTTGAVTNTAAAALTTINVTGAGAVTLGGTQQATVATINASAATGALTVALGSLVTQTVTGGSGNDVITTGAVLTTGSVNAGAGTGDVLVVGANVAHVNTTTLAAKYTNFEVIRVNGSLDMDLFPSITAVQLSGATNAITNLNATQAAAVTARADIGASTLTLKTQTGTSDVLNITFGLGTTDTAATSATTLTATGFETINMFANPGASASSGANRTTSVTAITDTSLTAVNLTGTAFTFGDIATTKAVAWDASALTGNGASTPVGLTLTTTGAAFAGSVVTGSALRDSVIMTTSTGVTFNLGLGNDIFSTTSALLLPSGAATDNTINAGGGTSDRLVITGAATLTDTHFTKTSGFEALELAGGAVSHSVTGLGAGFLGGFANGVSVTDTADQAANQTYTFASGLYAGNVTLTHTTAHTGDNVNGNQSITTGSGNDTITLNAALFTGTGSASTLSISTGAGDDIINVTTGNLLTTHITTSAVLITGGTGADVITVATHTNGTAVTGLLGNVQFNIAAGDSTTTAFDKITGFIKADGTGVSDTLNFDSVTLTAYTAAAATGFTAAELTVAVSAVGLTTFAGTSAAALTVAQKIAALQSVVVTNEGDSAFFIDSGNTFVFNNNSAGDSVVQLIGQTGATALITTNAVTDLAIHFA